MGIIPNITEEDRKAIRNDAEAMLEAQLRSEKRRIEEAKEALDRAYHSYEMSLVTWALFVRQKETSKNS